MTRRMVKRIVVITICVLGLITALTTLTSIGWTRIPDGDRYDVTRVIQDDGINYTGVIILTYMRSGSSLTGDILQQNDNVFYVFEPLRILQGLLTAAKPIQWLNGSISPVNSVNAADVQKQALVGWLSCNFSLVYAQSFDDLAFMAFGKQTMMYRACILNNFNKTVYNPDLNKTKVYLREYAFKRGLHETCLQLLRTACLKSKIRIIKTIRASMLTAEAILSDIRGYKVINVIRDPFFTVLSQAQHNGCIDVRNGTANCAKRHCERAWNDVIVKRRMPKYIYDRVLTMYYEKMVANPILQTEIIYEFIGLQLSDTIKDYVKRIVLEGNVTGCKICEELWQKGDTVKKPYNFVKAVNVRHVPDLENLKKVCKNVLKHYEYRW